MTVEKLIEVLKTAEDQKAEVLIACDEEWNTLFKDVRVEATPENKVVIFGCSGSEVEE